MPISAIRSPNDIAAPSGSTGMMSPRKETRSSSCSNERPAPGSVSASVSGVATPASTNAAGRTGMPALASTTAMLQPSPIARTPMPGMWRLTSAKPVSAASDTPRTVPCDPGSNHPMPSWSATPATAMAG